MIRETQAQTLPKFFAIDFFCGAGGTTQGLIEAGGYVIAGVDKVDHCRETYERNNVNRTLDMAPARYIQKDIFDRTEDYPEGQGHELLVELGALLEHYQTLYPTVPLLLAICAPCQPFTQMTKIEMSDERAMARIRDRGLLGQTFKFVEQLAPTMILSENVAGIQNRSYGGVWQDFEAKLRNNGYAVGSKVVDTANYGIPQHRKRSIMLAVNKRDCLPDALEHIGTDAEKVVVPDDDGSGRFVTVGEAIGHLPSLAAGERHTSIANHECAKLSDLNLKRIRLAQPGGTNHVFDEHGLALPCHTRIRDKSINGKAQSGAFSDIYTRMHPDKPAPTMTTKCVSISNGRFGHPDVGQNRAISVREAAALQTFPDDYVFYGKSIVHTSKMVGNAVPPKLSEFFAGYLLKSLDPAAGDYHFPDDTVSEIESAEAA